MRAFSEFLLTFLLNAAWQIGLIAIAAVVADRCLRRTRIAHRHLLWVAAFGLSIVLPVVSSLSSLRARHPVPVSHDKIVAEVVPFDLPASVPAASNLNSVFQISARVAAAALIGYFLVLGLRALKLFRAWVRTRAARHDAHPLEANARIQTLLADCQRAVGVKRVSILSSPSLRAPATIGVFHHLLILPADLLHEADDEALTAAIGHELVHVRRRDYLMNLIYEGIFLPLSFHPAAALMRRRITQTRELRCDELVSDLLLGREVYARSLVRLARSAMPIGRRARTVAVGIADADILEVRIMSLLMETKLNTGKKRLWLFAAALLLLVPCAVAATFAPHLNIATASAQEQDQKEKKEVRTREDRERFEREMKEHAEREDKELKEKIANEPNAETREKLEAELARRQEQRARGLAYTSAGQTFSVMAADEAHIRAEREAQSRRQAELARQARISMDRAIQIATSQTPGKVLECSLIGERWEGPEGAAKPSLVLYRVTIITGDEANPGAITVLVNAIDGSIFRTLKEERRGEEVERRGQEPIRAGALNGKALNVPEPEYPAIAKAAHASGDVKVLVTIDENGDVIYAKAIEGHPLLQAAAVAAARQAKFKPTFLNNEPVKVKATLTYNFVEQ